jgi:hypothetical protein
MTSLDNVTTDVPKPRRSDGSAVGSGRQKTPLLKIWSAAFFVLFLASCAGPQAGDPSTDQFVIESSEGPVLATVEPSDTGYTDSELTNVISAGVADRFAIRCSAPSRSAEPSRQMFWQVNKIWKTNAQISASLVAGGKVVKSTFMTTGAPGTNPDADFEYAVARLASRMLPTSRQSADPSSGCSYR